MINIYSKNECCGCGACYQICPQRCISMVEDNEGFLYPKVDPFKCIECGICEKVCPILNKENIKNTIMDGYIFQNSNKAILKESTSGGFFTSLGEYVIKNGGVVFGAAFDENFVIKHMYVEAVEELRRFRNSKYTQSDTSNTYRECKSILDKGRLVCYSGTPCQVEGLRRYLKKEYDNLILVDFACRGTPSPKLLRKYLEYSGGIEQISRVLFRDKKYGYYSSIMSIQKKDDSFVKERTSENPILTFFFKDICSRPSCYKCRFKKMDRVSDFTLFDSWHAFYHAREFGKAGATNVIIRSTKAKKIFDNVSKQNLSVSADCGELIREDGTMIINSASPNALREAFFEELDSLDFTEFVGKYYNLLGVSKAKNILKDCLIKMRIFNLYVLYTKKYR